MTELPAELTVVLEDHGGLYTNGLDCPIARALKREGVKGALVYGCGNVGFIGQKQKRVGTYAWADGETFSAWTPNKIGKLVLQVPARRFEEMVEELEARYGR